MGRFVQVGGRFVSAVRKSVRVNWAYNSTAKRSPDRHLAETVRASTDLPVKEAIG